MLEKIMDLHILLYSMAAIGAVGAIGMLATNLTYRRLLKSTGSRKAGSKKWGHHRQGESEREMAKPLENQGQAFA